MENTFKQISKIIVDETEYGLDALTGLNADIVSSSGNSYHLLLDNMSIDAELIQIDIDQKLVVLRIDGSLYNVEIVNKLDELIHELGFDLVDNQVDKNIKAPMPGLVLDVMVNAGEEVRSGQALLILEAMKMENIIQAPADGVIDEIFIGKSDSVEKNQLLISLK